ncbi:MAG: HAMP domain-containing histidine kinase [Bacteroidetes bacterium]|nr:HAMP domain-containing histidine kinase [Bacteroidota bacterium]
MMTGAVIIGSAFSVGLVVLLKIYIKSLRQTKAMKIQSRQIQNQLLELTQQNDALLKSNQEKMQLISLVSHDLKGPFNRIFALVQLFNLHQENLTSEQKEYLGKIHNVATDGLSLVRNLLDSRRLEDKGMELHPADLDLNALVSSLVKNYSSIAEKKNIRLKWNPAAPLILFADKLYLSRVIENLLSNALKFSPENKTVTVLVSSLPTKIELTVQDEGPGISAEDQAKLFQRFQRLSARPTGGESSTGLGLFIVKSMVEKMGGQVLCKSELGNGTTFTVSLPKNSH